MLRLKLAGRFMDGVKEDMKSLSKREEDVI